MRMKTEQEVWGDGSRSLVFVQAVPSGLTWGAISGRAGSAHAWRPTVLQGPCFLTPATLPSVPGLGVCNREIILKKSMKDDHQHDFLLCAASQVPFLWGFSRLRRCIVRSPHYISPFLFSQQIRCRATSSSILRQFFFYVSEDQTVRIIHPDIMVPSNPLPKVLIHNMGLTVCKLSSISSNKSVSWSYCK